MLSLLRWVAENNVGREKRAKFLNPKKKENMIPFLIFLVSHAFSLEVNQTT